jgi:2,5-diketo-D-gluconate reductase A
LRAPVVVELARRHAVSPAQIVLRWHLEQGLAFTARSSVREEIAQNIALFDFTLGPEDLELMRSLDGGRAPARDPERHGH